MAKRKIKNIFEDWTPEWKFVRGEGKWNYFVEPDDYDNWGTQLYGKEVEELIPELEEIRDKAVEFVKEQGKEVTNVNPVYKEDKEGNKYINFRKKKYDEETTPPKLYNVSGDEITGEFNQPVGGGSTLRVKTMIKPYYIPASKTVGVSTKLIAVQIIKNNFNGTSAGFSDESGEDNPPFDFDSSKATESDEY